MSLSLRALSTALATTAFVAAAAARPFQLPHAAPAAVIEAPDDWSLTETRDGVEGAVAGGAVKLSARYLAAPNAERALADERAALKRRGLTLAAAPRARSAGRWNGLDGVKLDFAAVAGHDPIDLTVILVGLPKAGFVALAYWGDGDAEEAAGNDLLRIADSIAPRK